LCVFFKKEDNTTFFAFKLGRRLVVLALARGVLLLPLGFVLMELLLFLLVLEAVVELSSDEREGFFGGDCDLIVMAISQFIPTEQQDQR
jgi:hypothetical protein